MVTSFKINPAFETGSVASTDWDLCHVRLQDDARFPWLILIPRVDAAVELTDLSPGQRGQLMDEIIRAGAIVRAIGDSLGRPVDKLNIAAIGNVTAQLHIHVVGRRRDDGLWPDPIWGRGASIRQDGANLARALALITAG
jgi:diadenosine tetraphosphate (Ap4A) HIT family hydrolase